MMTSMKILAFALMVLASPAFAHGGGNGHGMGHDMTPDVNHATTMSQNTWKDGRTHDSKRTDRTNTSKQQLSTKIGTEVQALLAKYTLFLHNANTRGQQMILSQLQSLSKLAAQHGINETIGVGNTSVTIGRNVGGMVVIKPL
jgi:hypothetical protein